MAISTDMMKMLILIIVPLYAAYMGISMFLLASILHLKAPENSSIKYIKTIKKYILNLKLSIIFPEVSLTSCAILVLLLGLSRRLNWLSSALFVMIFLEFFSFLSMILIDHFIGVVKESIEQAPARPLADDSRVVRDYVGPSVVSIFGRHDGGLNSIRKAKENFVCAASIYEEFK